MKEKAKRNPMSMPGTTVDVPTGANINTLILEL